MIKRLVSEEQLSKIKDLKKYKGKKISELTQIEKDELIEIIAKKLKIL